LVVHTLGVLLSRVIGTAAKRQQYWWLGTKSVTSPAMGHWGTCPLLGFHSFIYSSLWSKYDSQLSKYYVVCETSWCRCRQLTALSISTTLLTKLLVIKPLPASLGPEVRGECPMTKLTALPLLATNPVDATAQSIGNLQPGSSPK